MINPLFLMMRWIQTIPLSLLAFVPFQDGELRWNRRRGYLVSVGYMILGSIALAMLSPLASLGSQRNIAARDISLAVFLAIYFSGWACSIHTKAVRKLLAGEILLHYEAMLQAVSNVFAALVLNGRYKTEVNAEAGSLAFNLCLLAATAVSWPLVWYFLRHILRKNLPALDDRDAVRGLGYLCVMLLLFTAAIYNPRYDLHPEVPVFVAALAVTDMIAYYIFFQETGAVRRQAEMARQLSDYQMQYQKILGRMENMRQLRHDIRHHLNMLSTLNAQGRKDDIAVYLEQYGRVFTRLEQPRFSGDPAIDGILEYYMAQANEEGIPMDCRVLLWSGSSVAHMDMTVLLGNCLENAMEALRRLPPEERRLSVQLQSYGPALLLQIRNTCEAGMDSGGFAGWKSFPSSKDADRRGVGLRSVTEIAKKYNGSAQFQRTDREFTAQVTLYMLAGEAGFTSQNGNGT